MEKEEAEALIQAHVKKHFEPHFSRFRENLIRVRSLLEVSSKLSEPMNGDVLRSTVVFIHATMEDYLRHLGMLLLPSADEVTLNQVPLVDSTHALRAEKFYLGRLCAFREKTVKEVISESVIAYLNRRTFNDVDEIAGFLYSVGFDVEGLRPHLAAISPFIARRHAIVHRADLADSEGVARTLTPISKEDVGCWAKSLGDFLAALLSQRVTQEFKQSPELRTVAKAHGGKFTFEVQ